MMLIPYSILPPNILKKLSRYFYFIGRKLDKNFPKLDLHLKQAELRARSKEYISMSFTASLIFFILFSILTSFLTAKFEVSIFLGIFIVLFITLFIFSQQLMYPRLKANRRIRNIERNLIPGLQNMQIQLD